MTINVYLKTAGGYEPVTAVCPRTKTVFTIPGESPLNFSKKKAREIVDGLNRNGFKAFLVAH